MNPEHMQPMPMADISTKSLVSIYGKVGKPGRKGYHGDVTRLCDMSNEQKVAWNNTRAHFSPFVDPEPRKTRYIGNRWAGGKDERDAGTVVNGIEYRGITWYFPVALFNQNRADVARKRAAK